jgi:hypothetical protein
VSATVVVFTDGRRAYIERTIASFEEQVTGAIGDRVIHDDSGDDANHAWLRETFPEWRVIWHQHGRRGFGGAINNAWRHLADHASSQDDFVFHLEDDFLFNRAVDLDAMARVLAARPYLVQLALRRQPWNDDERAAGGIVEQHPDDYLEQTDGEHVWLEHRRFFTTNPSLYRRGLCTQGWPTGDHSEGRFGIRLTADPDVRFGYWGSRDSGEWVEHIGAERAGCGY